MLRFGISTGMFDLVNLIGILTVAIASTLIGNLLISHTAIQNNISTPILFLILFFILSLVIASLFFTVWGMIADTLIHCFCVEEEIN